MIGPRLGAHMSIAGGVDKSFLLGEEVGCETIQIFNKSNNQWHAKPLKTEEIESFKNNRERTGIEPVVAHDSYLINLASPDEGLLKKSREAFLIEMERCEILEIPYLVMHPGSHVGSGVETGLARIAESLNWLHDQTSGYRLQVLLETTAGQGTNLGFNFEQLSTIIKKVAAQERLGVCLDTCHVFAAGYDIGSEQGYADTWKQFEDVLGLDRLKVIHLNDAKKDLGSRVDRHEHIGAGAIGLEGFRRLVNDERLTHIPMILETPKGTDYAEDKENLAVLRGLIER